MHTKYLYKKFGVTCFTIRYILLHYKFSTEFESVNKVVCIFDNFDVFSNCTLTHILAGKVIIVGQKYF